MHAERLPRTICLPTLVLTAQAAFLLECRQTDRQMWLNILPMLAAMPAWVMTWETVISQEWWLVNIGHWSDTRGLKRRPVTTISAQWASPVSLNQYAYPCIPSLSVSILVVICLAIFVLYSTASLDQWVRMKAITTSWHLPCCETQLHQSSAVDIIIMISVHHDIMHYH